jgi:hypothetical protein
MMLLLDPTPFARGLAGKKVEVVNYPDGRFAVRHEDNALPFRVTARELFSVLRARAVSLITRHRSMSRLSLVLSCQPNRKPNQTITSSFPALEIFASVGGTRFYLTRTTIADKARGSRKWMSVSDYVKSPTSGLWLPATVAQALTLQAMHSSVITIPEAPPSKNTTLFAADEILGSAATRVGRQRSQAAHFYSWNPALRCWTTAAAQPRWLPYRPGDLRPHRGRTVLICKPRQADGDKLVFATIKPRWYPTWLGV